MKIRIIVVIIFLGIPNLSYSLHASKFFNALETNNLEHVLSNIDVSSTLSTKEIAEFFRDMKEICEIRYGVFISLLQVQQDIWEICKQNISNSEDLFKIELFLAEVLDPENSHSYLFLTSHKGKKNVFEDKDIPINVILGCVEIGCGALLWITPFRAIGNILIGDGCRRMFNEVESVEKARNPYHNTFQKLLTSGTILHKL